MGIGNDDPEWPLVIVSNGWISRSEHSRHAGGPLVGHAPFNWD